jgi:hypothetical protein
MFNGLRLGLCFVIVLQRRIGLLLVGLLFAEKDG